MFAKKERERILAAAKYKAALCLSHVRHDLMSLFLYI